MKKILSGFLLGLIILSIAFPVLAQYYANLQVSETSGTSYDMLAISQSADIETLADNGYINPSGTDTRVLSGATELPWMLADDRLLFAMPVTGSTSYNLQFTTGNNETSSFPIIAGDGGYVTTADDADLELSNDDFSIDFEGWLDTSYDNPTPMYADYSYHASATHTTANYTHIFNLPLGWLYSGSLLIAIIETTSNLNSHIIIQPIGWTTLVLSSSPDPTRNLWIGYKISTGTGSTITVTTGTNSSYDTYAAYRAFSFPVGQFDGMPEVAVATEASTANPNPPEITPSWGEYPIMTIAGFGAGYDAARNVTSYPSGYVDGEFQEAAGASYYAYVGTANDNVIAGSEDPGIYTLNATVQAKAFTIAVQGVLPEEYFIAHDNSIYIYPDDGTLNAINCNLWSSYAVSANVSTGNHSGRVWRSDTYWYMDVDGVNEDSHLIYALDFPDTSGNWTIANMPYCNYYQLGFGAGAETRYEYYNTGATSGWNFYGNTWLAQTFTPDITHTITSANLSLYRVGSPGTLNVSVWATDGSGHPTGSALCVGTTNGNTLNLGSASWRSVSLGSGATVMAGTKYALGISAPSGSAGNFGVWEYDGTAPAYSGGGGETSGDAGSSWSAQAIDFLFEEYGTSPNVLITYEPDAMIEGSVLPNEEAPGTYDGLFVWGSNPSGLSSSLSGLLMDTTPPLTLPGVSIPEDVLPETGQPGYTTPTGDRTGNPFFSLMEFGAWWFNIPVGLFYVLLFCFGAFYVMVLIYAQVPHQLFALLGCGGVYYLGYQIGILPWWVIFVFVLMALAIVVKEHSPSIG